TEPAPTTRAAVLPQTTVSIQANLAGDVRVPHIPVAPVPVPGDAAGGDPVPRRDSHPTGIGRVGDDPGVGCCGLRRNAYGRGGWDGSESTRVREVRRVVPLGAVEIDVARGETNGVLREPAAGSGVVVAGPVVLQLRGVVVLPTRVLVAVPVAGV